MTTMTISLPDDLASQVDDLSTKKGFATRSEFIRHLVRSYLQDELRLEQYKTIPLDEMETALKSSGKYDPRFIQSVVSGLRKSSAYEG